MFTSILCYFLFSSYGSNIWGLTTEENLNKIEVIQKKCLRIMTFSDFNSHTNPLFIDLKLLKVRDIIKLNQLKLVYEFYNNALPTDLHNLFNFNCDIHKTNLELNSVVNNICTSLVLTQPPMVINL